MENCQNCGHKCHCGEKCMQTYKDGDGKDVKLCCKECNCDEECRFYGKNEII